MFEIVARPKRAVQLEAPAVAASPVTAGAAEICLEVIPGRLVRRDDPRPQRRIPHADILPQGRWRGKEVDPDARLRQCSGMTLEVSLIPADADEFSGVCQSLTTRVRGWMNGWRFGRERVVRCRGI
jgi:hypothetical protein